MEDNIIIAIAIGTGTGAVITVLIFVGYWLWTRNGVPQRHGCCVGRNDLEKNDTTLDSSSTESDRDYIVALGEVDSISTLTRTVRTGMHVTIDTLAEEWRNGDRVLNLHSIHHSPTNTPKKNTFPGDHGSVGTIKMNNCSPKGRVDDVSIGTQKVNNCTATKMKAAEAGYNQTYLSGESLTLHNETMRREL